MAACDIECDTLSLVLSGHVVVRGCKLDSSWSDWTAFRDMAHGGRFTVFALPKLSIRRSHSAPRHIGAGGLKRRQALTNTALGTRSLP